LYYYFQVNCIICPSNFGILEAFFCIALCLYFCSEIMVICNGLLGWIWCIMPTQQFFSYIMGEQVNFQ